MTKQILINGILLTNKQADAVCAVIKYDFDRLHRMGGEEVLTTSLEEYRTLSEIVAIFTPKWKRYHLVASSKNSHPLKFPPPGPFWQEPVEGQVDSVYIVAYLPGNESIENWWPNAKVKQVEDKDHITYSVYHKPSWWQGE